MSNIVVDDTDPSLTYSGPWNLLIGSSRQWDSTVHSTFQSGATVSFRFQGSVCKVYGTVPPGNGSTILMDVTIDGSVSPIVSRTTSSAADYANLFYQSSNMQSTVWHTVIITNRGGAGSLDFEFDRVELDADDIVPTVAPFSPASSPQMSASSTSSTLPKTSLNPTGAVNSITTTSITNALSGTFSSSQAPAQSTRVPSTSPSVLTQIVTTTRQDGSVATSEVTLFPNATSQAGSSSAHTVPVRTVISIVGGIIALVIVLLLLILFYRRRRAKNHHFALMGISSDSTAQNMSQNRTTVATPFTLGPSSSSAGLNAALYSPSRLPLFSEKALRQQTRVNRSENDLEATLTCNPALFPSSNDMAFSASAPSIRATGSISNVEALTLKRLSLNLFPLSGSPATSPPAAPQGPPGPNGAYFSGSTSIGPSTSAYGDTITAGMYDVPPAYRPNE